MSRAFGVTDGPSFIRELNLRLARLERIGVLTGAATFLKVVQSNALISALPEGAEHVFVLPVDPAESQDVTTGDVWKDTSYPEPVVRVWDGDEWIRSTDPALDQALSQQAGSINVYLDQPEPTDERRPAGSLWMDPDSGTLMRWLGEQWVAAPMPGSGELDVIRKNVDAAMDAANGKNKMTYTNVAQVDAPGPTPAPDPERTVGDVHRNRDENTFVIYATWQWDGSAWNPTSFGDEVLDSLDVGKLSAGAADIDTAVINKFWANESWVDQAHANILTIGSISPDMLTSSEELSVNPTWSRDELRDAAPFDLPSGMSFSTSYPYRGGTYALHIGAAATPAEELRITDTAQISPGELVHAKIALRDVSASSGAGYKVGLVAHWLDDDGVQTGTSTFEISHDQGTTYVTYERLFDAPDGTSQFYLTVTGGTLHAFFGYAVGMTSVRRTMSSIDDDGIQTIVSPGGVEVSVLLPTDDGFERVVLTQMGRFYSAYDPETDQSSTMTGNEVATGVLAARDDVTINGESVRAAIAASGGRVVMFDRAADSGALSLTEIGYREFGCAAEGGQAYLLIVKADIMGSEAGSSFLYLRKTEAAPGSSPTPPTISTPEFARRVFHATGGGEQVYLITAFVPNDSESTRWLISGRSGGTRTLQFRDMWAYAVRLGNFTELPSSGRYTYGGATPTEPSPPAPPVDPDPPPQTYVHTSVFEWSRTYNNFGSNPSAWVDPGLMRQGAAGSSRYMALVGMSAAARTAAMAGQISKMEMYVYHDGPTPSGTLKISTHQQASMPAYSSGPSVTLFDSYKDKYLARSSGSWITLPSAWYPDFQSGLRRGFAFGSTTGNWGLMDLAAHNYTHSDPTTQAERRPKIRITYSA